MRAAIALGLALALGSFPLARAQAPATSARPAPVAIDSARAADLKAIQDGITAFEKAFAAGDARAIVATFTDDATVADDKGSTKGSSGIQARYAEYFAANPRATIAIKPDSVRFLTPDVAIEEGRATVTLPESGGPLENTKYTVVYVKQDGRWLQSSLRDLAADEPAVPERLKDLEWLVGDWVNESSAAVVQTTCKWSEDKHYLLRDFSVMVAGKPALKGTQRIGWDPAAKMIRSWVFDSDGGFSEGYWSRLGDQWMIKSHGVHHDGRPVTATMMITRINPGTLRWSAFDRTRVGDLIPDVDEFTLVRRPPAPK
jgi:uncharacterized protein (TIGR02246 family)